MLTPLADVGYTTLLIMLIHQSMHENCLTFEKRPRGIEYLKSISFIKIKYF